MPRSSCVDTCRRGANRVSSREFLTTKICRDCGESKSLEEFSPSKKNRDGRVTYCRPCLRIREAAYRDAARGGPPRRPEAVREGHKRCPACKAELPLAEFGKNRSTRDGLNSYCFSCHNMKTRESRERAGGSRGYHLKRRYGITREQFAGMVEQQGGLCAICGIRSAEHVDHDHMTGRVRGVLCFNCNGGLGQFKDRIASLRAAIDYLETSTWQKSRVCTGVFRL